ncbi:hypothetical protein GOP47_0023407 [Adiantum capillus-veneris]|uniref:Secreted protein n=1 Tax=Adiantum capillus-veneris TaxID=13818 RepID=A0A9D4U3U6_ADICA|nr:hypothetical protein GOP47_0023407 [Adiantum capillus-veneris]
MLVLAGMRLIALLLEVLNELPFILDRFSSEALGVALGAHLRAGVLMLAEGNVGRKGHKGSYDKGVCEQLAECSCAR